MAALEDVGLTANLSAFGIEHLVAFRLSLSTNAAELFRASVLHMTQGRFIACVKNCSRVARLHRTMWSIPKICIMMYVYCQLICDKPASSQALASSSGCFSEKVNSIEEATIADLSAEKLLLSTFAIFPAPYVQSLPECGYGHGLTANR